MTNTEKQRLLSMLDEMPENFSIHNHIEVTDLGDGWATARLDIHPDTLNIWNIPHGGALFTLADMVTGTAAFTLRQEVCLTVQTNMDFIAAAPGEGAVLATGKVLRCGKKLCFCEAELTDESGKLLARASAVLSFSGEKLELAK